MISLATDKTFTELTSEGFAIVDFYTNTCVPCKMFSRILEDLTEDYEFLNIVKVNLSDYPSLGEVHQVEAVPTAIFMKDGVKLETVVGLMDEDEIIEKISQYYYGE